MLAVCGRLFVPANGCCGDARLACSWQEGVVRHPPCILPNPPSSRPLLAAAGAGGLFCQLVRPLPHDAAGAAASGAGAARPAGGGQGRSMLWSVLWSVLGSMRSMLWSCCGHAVVFPELGSIAAGQ